MAGAGSKPAGAPSAPSLDEIEKNPAGLEGLSVHILRLLRARALTVAHAAEVAELRASSSAGTPAEPEDRALTPEEAGAILGCPADRLRHHARQWPYAELLSPARTPKRLRFSSARIQAYLRGDLSQPGPSGSPPVQSPRRKRGPRPARLPFPSPGMDRRPR
jgi:hypothetical protein